MLNAERSCAMGVEVAEVLLFVADQIHGFIADAQRVDVAADAQRVDHNQTPTTCCTRRLQP